MLFLHILFFSSGLFFLPLSAGAFRNVKNKKLFELKASSFCLVEKGAGVGKKMPAGEFLLHRFLCSCKENDEPSGLRFLFPFLALQVSLEESALSGGGEVPILNQCGRPGGVEAPYGE